MVVAPVAVVINGIATTRAHELLDPNSLVVSVPADSPPKVSLLEKKCSSAETRQKSSIQGAHMEVFTEAVENDCSAFDTHEI